MTSKTAPIESVWDYPRPPRVEECGRHIRIVFNGVVIADTRRAKRVLETSHPPVYYIPPDDICMEYLSRTPRMSVCEWKGQAAYYTLMVGEKQSNNAAWSYQQPLPEVLVIKDHLAFYPAPMDACTVDGERVVPQPGGFYGGWITSDIRGPFKGEPGTQHMLRALQMARLEASSLLGTQHMLRPLQMARLEASSLLGTQHVLRALQMARLEASSLPGTQGW